MSDFLKKIKKAYGEEVHIGIEKAEVWDTGVYNLNAALGGGLPAGRISLLVGKESVGKSSLAAKMAGVVNCTNWQTGEYCDPAAPESCKVLYVDQEGTLDKKYCEFHNFFPEKGGNVVLSTTTGNQCIDVINAALQSKEFSFIVLDSLEALIPFKDLEKSSEDFVMGTKAKMNNAAFRNFTVSIIEASREAKHWWQRPTLLVINQLRDTISAVPAPPTIPGGIGQRQAASVIIQMNTPKYKDDGKFASIVNFKGVVKKNKVATPRAPIDFEMAVKDLPELGMGIGDVDNATSVIKDVRKNNIWEKKDDGLWHLFGYTAEKQDEFLAKMKAEPDVYTDIMRQTLAWLKK